jgi:hypothetical protein
MTKIDKLKSYLQELVDESILAREVVNEIMFQVRDIIEPNETLLRKDLIQRFYDINGMDCNVASSIDTHSVIDGHEMVLESAAYDNMGYFKGLFPDMKSYVLSYSQPTN